MTNEKLSSERLLKCANLLAQCRLGHLKNVGRLAERMRFGDRDKEA